jgi:hypothetical protein
VSRRNASSPSAVDRLTGVQIDAESGLHIGTIFIGRQLLRVGIRPLPHGAVPAGPPLLLFNGIGANMELAAPLMGALDKVETLIFDLPGAGSHPRHACRIACSRWRGWRAGCSMPWATAGST